MERDHWDDLFDPVPGHYVPYGVQDVDRWRSNGDESATGGTVEYDYPYASLITVRDIRARQPWKPPSRQGKRPGEVRISTPRSRENERKRKLYAENPEYAERQREKNRRNRKQQKEATDA